MTPKNWSTRTDPALLAQFLLAPQNRNRFLKLAFAVSDQVLFSGSNFVVSVLLGRWMVYEAYGAFTYAYALLLLLASFHNALLLEPFTVLGSSEHRFTLSTYTQRMARLQLYWTVIVGGLSLPIGLGLWLTGDDRLGGALLGLSIAQGAILYFWYVRRKWYVVGRIHRAVLGTAVFAALQIGAVFGLQRAGILSPFSALAAIGASSLVAATLGRFAPADTDERPEPLPIAQIVTEHWRYGKWVALAGIFFWLTGQSYNVLTGSVLNLADAGGLKALQNLINPVVQLLTAFNLVFLPWVTRRHAERGTQVMVRDLVLYTVFSTSCAAAYWLVLVALRGPIFELLYGGRYGEYLYLLPVLALLPLVSALTASWTIGLRVLRETQLIFWVDSAGALFTITVGVLLVYRFGLSGAVAGTVISSVSRIPVLVVLWRRATKTTISEPELAGP